VALGGQPAQHVSTARQGLECGCAAGHEGWTLATLAIPWQQAARENNKQSQKLTAPLAGLAALADGGEKIASSSWVKPWMWQRAGQTATQAVTDASFAEAERDNIEI